MNVHIYPSNFKNESRIEKQANSISKLNVFKKVLLIGAGANSSKALSSDTEIILLGEDNGRASLVGKIIRFIKWYKAIIFFLKDKEVECINAHSLSVLPLCVYLKKVKKAKLVYDTHELETETNSTAGLKKLLAKKVERLLISKTDHIFVVSNSIKNFYQELYQRSDIDVVLNAPSIKEPLARNIFRERLGISEDNLIFLYQGVLSKGRGIELLLESFSKIQNKNVSVVFMGYGPLEEVIQEYQEEYSNIFHFPAVSPEMVHEHTSSADVGFALIENTCLSYEYCMPNKLFEYGMAGIPCIVSRLPEMKSYVDTYECGFILGSQEPAELLRLIDTIMSSNISVFKENARRGALDNNWQEQEKIMLKYYKKEFGRSA